MSLGWIFSTSISLGLVVWSIWMYYYWPRKKIPVLPSEILSGMALFDATFARNATRSYKGMKKSKTKYAGIFSVFQPVLVVIDLDLVKEILTDPLRDHFYDKGYHESCDIWLQMAEPLILDSRDWRDTCQKLTPDFSSRHVKIMHKALLIANDLMCESLMRFAEEKREIDVKEFLACFTTDFIGLDCFNITCNSFNKSEAIARQLPIVGGLTRNLKMKYILDRPGFSSMIGLQPTEEDIAQLIHDQIRKELKGREHGKNEGGGIDIIHLNKLRQHMKHPYDTCQMLSHLTMFCSLSFDIPCTTMFFAIYELCRNPDIQEKARKEVQEVLEKHKGRIDSESLAEIVYLQQIMHETLRMYPPAANFLRLCHKDFQLEHDDLIIRKRTKVFVPIFAMHRDEEYYPYPEKFDPERFNLENKESDTGRALFMPYGEGPRDCISIQAGLLQCKMGLVSILNKFRLHMSPKTRQPLREDPEIFMKTIDKLYVRAEKLNNA